ncbi:hypothetical protein CROQUDRAFT_660693 [Cronartium quercuum f. sp. fusiforme G11]|uniref:Mitochondrial glycine transporter n=1 Tax=Cronartium quercuum f. sp. fusiforme G11 TaxID=708437 RepID=A0A9P6NDE0_9BASI|nr:hypothetical protein CROQUDRAFT_660693 [Cronartium quercuum f. sp. fusiforme G11]
MASQTNFNLPPVTLHLLSGAASGLASCVLLQPLDLVKTRMQQGQSGTVLSKGQPGIACLSRTHVFEVASTVVKQDGVLGLWRGTSPTIVRNVPGVALYFFSLAELRKFMTTIPIFSQIHRHPKSPSNNVTILPRLSPTGDLAAGMIARTAVGFLLMPITVVKTRFESSLYSYPSINSAFVDVVKNNGLVGLWRGFVPTMIRDAPFAGLFVVTYERAKAMLQSTSLITEPSLIHMISASTGATMATVLTTPFDFIKTQQQLRPGIHNGLWMSVKTIFGGEKANWILFFRGSSLRLVRKGLSSAIGWSIYEGLIRRWATK